MSKVLKTAAIVVGAVALVATGIGAAAAVGAFGTVVAGTAAAATLATVSTIATIAGAAAGVLSLAAGLTAKKPSAASTGSQERFSADPDAGIPAVVGRTGTAGNIVLRKGFDTKDAGDNDRQSFVSVLSLGPVKSVGGFTSDQSLVSFSGSGAALGALAGFMWMTSQLGALPEANALSFGAGAGTPPGWTAAHKLSGKAAATWTLRFDTKAKLFQGGVPAPMWVVEGGLCYDPRKDSTYPGGSGSHRMADPSNRAAYDAAVATWEYSENPYLHGLKWAHGIWQRDKSDATSSWQRVMGMGAPQAGIDVASFVEGANIADAKGWKVGGVIYSGDPKWDSFKKILQAGMGEPLTLGAKISCLVNAPRVSLAMITVDDVIGRASVAATQPRRDRINTVTPRYRLEANNWKFLPGPPISVPEHVAEDGGKRSKVLDYAFIQDTKQVATAVRYDIENAREFGPIVLPLKLYMMGYKPGDCVTATLPELGLNAQPILLLNRQLEPATGVVTMTARSETAAKHPFALGQTTTAPSTPGLSGPPLVPVPGEAAWAITATELESEAGASLPALVITGAADAATADAVVFEYRPFVSGQSAADGWISAGVEPPAVTRKEIVSLVGGADYEAAVSYRVRGVIGARRILGPVTVAALVAEGAPGANAITGLLTNENHTLPANADGSLMTYTGAFGNFRIYAGSTDVTASFTFTVQANPQALTGPLVNGTINGATGEYSVNGGFNTNELSATLTIRATGAGAYAGVTVDKVFTLSKSLAGEDGTSPPLIVVTSTHQTFRYDKDNAVLPQTTTIKANRQNTSATTVWRLYSAAGTLLIGDTTAAGLVGVMGGSSSPDNDTIVVPHGTFQAVIVGNNTSGLIFETVVSGAPTVADRISIVKVQDGATGPGVMTLVNKQNATIEGAKVTKTGGAANTWDASAHSLQGYAGNVQASAEVVSASSHVMVGLNSDPNTTASFTDIDVAAYCAAGSFQGYANGSQAFTSGTVAAGQFIYARRRGDLIEWGIVGEAAPRHSMTIAAFNAAYGTSLSVATKLHFDSSIYTAGAQIDACSLLPLGADGETAYAAVLSNESHTLPATAAGAVTSYAGASGSFKVYHGSTDVTSSFTFAVQANPQALTGPLANGTITAATGAYSVNGGFDAAESSATLTIRASGTGVHAGVTIDKIFTLAKSNAGAAGTNAKLIYVSSSTQTVRLNAAGAVYADTITFKSTRQNAAGGRTSWRYLDANGNERVSWRYAQDMATALAGTFIDDDTWTISAAQLSAHMNFTSSPGAIFEVRFDNDTTLSDRISVVKVQDGATGDDGADGISITAAVSPVLFKFAYGGAAKSGELPRQVKVTLRSGGSDVSAAAAWSIATSGGAVGATVSATGLVTITAATPAGGWIDVTATYQGSAVPLRLPITVQQDAPPPSTARQLSQGIDTQTTDAASYLSNVDTVIVTVMSSASGVLPGTLSLTYEAAQLGNQPNLKTYTLAAKLRYRTPGGTWLDFAAGETTGSQATVLESSGGGTSGSLNISTSQTGLSANANYEVAAAFRRSAGNTVGLASGTLTAGSPT